MLLLACADPHQPFSRLSYFNIFEFALLKQLKICSGIPRPVSERDFHHPLEEEKKTGSIQYPPAVYPYPRETYAFVTLPFLFCLHPVFSVVKQENSVPTISRILARQLSRYAPSSEYEAVAFFPFVAHPSSAYSP